MDFGNFLGGLLNGFSTTNSGVGSVTNQSGRSVGRRPLLDELSYSTPETVAPAAMAGWGNDLGLKNVGIPENMNQVAPIEKPSTGRRSIMDILGGIADGIATAGGATPQYRASLDARLARDRQADTDAMRKSQFELQQLQGTQSLAKGEFELGGAQRELLGQATRGLAAVYNRGGVPALEKAWPIISQQFGMPPEQAASLGQSLFSDPEGTLTAFNAALTEPSNQGSQAKELQIIEMLDKRDPSGKLSQQFLNSLATGMDAKEGGTLNLARERFNDARSWRTDPRNPANRRVDALEAKNGAAGPGTEAISSARDVLGQLRTELGTLRDNGGINAAGQSTAQRVGAFANENLPLVERISAPAGFSARQRLDGLLTQGVFSLIPLLTGAKLGGKSFDAKAEMDNLKKVIGSSSDYDASIRAIDAFERKLLRLELPGSAPRPKLSPRPTNRAPATTGGWKIIGAE